MPFRYRLQKVLFFRMQKRDEQLDVVRLAQLEVVRIQSEIDNTKNTLLTVRDGIRTAAHTMMEVYDNYIKHLYDCIDKLEVQKEEAIVKLAHEKDILTEMEKGVKILDKHKEKMKEAYDAEEKQAEMKRLDETAGLKHYAKTQARLLEELEDEGME